MKYINSVCDGCGLVLNEDDDIVVCPECGTPQHRECYKKENRCVNEHKHNEDFEWKRDSSSAHVPTREEAATEEKLPCPSCGHLNPRDAKRCENCSMKLIVFGMNLAEAPDMQRKKDFPSDDIPDYEAPFTLGKGDGFYPQEDMQHPPEQTQQETDMYPPYQQPYQQTPYGYGQFPPPPAQMPFESEEYRRENARQFLLFRFLGANAGKFMNAFRKIDSGRGLTFNWAALFFGPYWFFYRKLYKPGIIFLTVSTIVSLIFTPSMNEFLTACGPYAETVLASEDPAVYNAFMNTITPYVPLVISFYISNIAISLIAAMSAYPLYKKYAESSVNRIMSSPSSEIGLSLAAKLGGTSVISAIGCYFIMSLITSVVDMIMYGM